MCGISGVFYFNGESCQGDVDTVHKMNNIQKHRGPDDDGVTSQSNCVLGHRRLSIIDLSSAGHQPFVSDDGRYHLVYNGEIYNYIELRKELEGLGWSFRTKTDTEVLLKAYQQYGKDCLDKFNGMFAFLIYDTHKKTLFISRDRVGIKPLYYVKNKEKIYFASEIKAFKAIKGLSFTADKHSIFEYLVFNRTDVWERTFFEEVKRLPKGHYGECDCDGLSINQWWNADSFLALNSGASLNDVCSHIDEILTSSVRFRMRSDVPVGSCLSGGLDSSILLGILLKHKMARGNYSTFTASFPGESFDETKYVDALKREYDFDNYVICPSEDDIFSTMKSFVGAHDEPTLNAAYYAQYEVMRIAKEHGVTVLLDGQGGDENFAGYHYFLGFYLLGRLTDKKYGKFASDFFNIVTRASKETIYHTLLFQLLPSALRKTALLSQVPFIEKEFFRKNIDKSVIFNEFFDVKNLNESLAKHFHFKLEHLLRSEDRNSMAFSIETRVPYLDNRLIEYLLSVPEELKVKTGEIKHLQKLALGKYAVEDIVKRRDKLGFDTPMKRWVKEDRWEKLFSESFSCLKKKWPDIFKGNANAINRSDIRWKIIQLATWNDEYLN